MIIQSNICVTSHARDVTCNHSVIFILEIEIRPISVKNEHRHWQRKTRSSWGTCSFYFTIQAFIYKAGEIPIGGFHSIHWRSRHAWTLRLHVVMILIGCLPTSAKAKLHLIIPRDTSHSPCLFLPALWSDLVDDLIHGGAKRYADLIRCPGDAIRHRVLVFRPIINCWSFEAILNL